MHLVTSWGHYKENSDYRKLYWVKTKEKRRRRREEREGDTGVGDKKRKKTYQIF